MIILLRLRNITIFALFVLAVSFIYIGYTGFSDSPQITEEININNEPYINEEIQETANISEGVDKLDNPLVNEKEIINIDNYFIEFRIKRDKGRDAQVELLREIINNPNSTEEIRKKALNKLYFVSECISSEIKAENLLKAKGYEENVVLVEENKTTVVVNSENLTQKDMIKIADLVNRGTGCSIEEIAIIPKNN